MSFCHCMGTIFELAQKTSVLERYAEQLGMKNTQDALHELNEYIKNDRFSLAALGEFERGRSTLINALLCSSILPVDVVPTTASVIRITYGSPIRARAEFFDGSAADIDITELPDYATEKGSKSGRVREITVWFPAAYGSNNVDIFDTPGLNNTGKATKAAVSILGRTDAVIFTLSSNTNLSVSESEFIVETLRPSNISRIIFVITRMGGYPPDQQKHIVQAVRQAMEEMLIAKATDVLSDQPEELEAFRRKLGEMQIYGVDSEMALQARKNQDMELLEKSGFPAFERGIDELLFREFGRAMLEKQTGAMLNAAGAIFRMIQLQMLPLFMNESEFMAKCEAIENELAAIEKHSQEEIDRLDAAYQIIRKNIYEKGQCVLQQSRRSIYDTAANLSNARNIRAAVENFWKKEMLPLLSHEIHLYNEIMQNTIDAAIENERLGLDRFAEALSVHFGKIGQILEKTPSDHSNYASLAKFFTHDIGRNAYVSPKIARVNWSLFDNEQTPVSLAMRPFPPTPNQLRRDIGDAACRQLDRVLEKNHAEDMYRNQITNSFFASRKEINTTAQNFTDDMKAALHAVKEDFAVQKTQTDEKLQTCEAVLTGLSSITERVGKAYAAFGLHDAVLPKQ